MWEALLPSPKKIACLTVSSLVARIVSLARFTNQCPLAGCLVVDHLQLFNARPTLEVLFLSRTLRGQNRIFVGLGQARMKTHEQFAFATRCVGITLSGRLDCFGTVR